MGKKLTNDFSWSRSRAATFDECARRYWFHYYGSWGGWEETAPARVREAYLLKQLQTRWMWVGDVVHRTVERVLTAARAGSALDERAAVEWALGTMRAGFRESKAGEYRRRPKRACGLIEHEYGSGIDDEEWRRVADHMKACVATFYRSTYFAFLPKLPRGSWLPVEELSHFFLDGIKVFVKPDAAFRTGERTVEIVDWKTGRRDEEADPIQLACYSVYALEKRWAQSSSDVTATEYNLSSGKAFEGRMTDERLAQVKKDILASVAAMKKHLDDPEGNVASEARFPVAADARACRSCNFRKLCPESPLKGGGA